MKKETGKRSEAEFESRNGSGNGNENGVGNGSEAEPGTGPSEVSSEAVAEAWRVKYLGALAEQRNLARRHLRELESSGARGAEALARDLLEVADNLERTLAAVDASLAGSGGEAESGLSALRDGVLLVWRGLEEALARHGVRPFESLGAPLDPHRHEAMAERADAGAPGRVVEVVQRGWEGRDRLLRPARVIVSRKP